MRKRANELANKKKREKQEKNKVEKAKKILIDAGVLKVDKQIADSVSKY